jgi:uncharacterized membrane protein
MHKVLKITPERKYRWMLFTLLLVSSIISMILLNTRNELSRNREYIFLVRNLFLAWIPFIMASVAYSSRWLSKWPRIAITLFCMFFWLIFLPNAPYLLTDFQHLGTKHHAPLWYDITMLLWFAWTGLMLGIFSLYHMHEIVTQYLGKIAGWIFVITTIAITSFGVYLGRFLRWNTSDIIRHPTAIINDIRNNFSHPENYQTILLYTIPLALLFLLIYVTIHIFGNLVRERTADSV